VKKVTRKMSIKPAENKKARKDRALVH
jgi:hypothetical protein